MTVFVVVFVVVVVDDVKIDFTDNYVNKIVIQKNMVKILNERTNE